MKKLFPIFLVAAGLLLSFCGKDPYAALCSTEYSAGQDSTDRRAIREFVARKGMTGVKTTASGLSYYIYEEGEGQAPRANSVIRVDYRGSFIADTTGKAFDSSGVHTSLSMNQVIKGWTEGLQLIKTGGKIRLMIPSHLAYGNCGNGGIPPNTPLVFDIRLVEIAKY
ncbi:putative FKBP-type peptidyl-prolyl cis-trans isomerase FkpA precursor [compost metagenome]